MRSVVAEDTKVGLLLFDEPSAWLDPVAEHGEINLPRYHVGGCTHGHIHSRLQTCSIDSAS